MIIRIVKMTFREECVEDFKLLFLKSKEQIANSIGCSRVELLRDTVNQSIFFTYSIWDSEEDLNRYRKSDLFKKVWGETKTYFADKPVANSLRAIAEA